jgi:hypothetical protein
MARHNSRGCCPDQATRHPAFRRLRVMRKSRMQINRMRRFLYTIHNFRVGTTAANQRNFIK